MRDPVFNTAESHKSPPTKQGCFVAMGRGREGNHSTSHSKTSVVAHYFETFKALTLFGSILFIVFTAHISFIIGLEMTMSWKKVRVHLKETHP